MKVASRNVPLIILRPAKLGMLELRDEKEFRMSQGLAMKRLMEVLCFPPLHSLGEIKKRIPYPAPRGYQKPPDRKPKRTNSTDLI